MDGIKEYARISPARHRLGSLGNWENVAQQTAHGFFAALAAFYRMSIKGRNMTII